MTYARARRLAFSLAVTALPFLSASPPALAAEVGEIAGDPVSLSVTNTAIGVYHFDNRNTRNVSPATRVDDGYAELLDRLNVQLNWSRLRFGLRLDGSAYLLTPSLADARRLAAEDQRSLGQEPTNDYANRYYRELNTRFQSSLYPSKLYFGYAQKGLDITAGDFYVQLGRGLVFSVRKIDELAIDTTVRGVKVAADRRFEKFQLAATAFAGQMNPMRVDEQSGRQLSQAGSPLFFGFPSANDLSYYQEGADGQLQLATDRARPSYLPDTVVGGRVEGGTSFVKLGANAAVLLRQSYAEENLRCVAACGGDARCVSDCGADFPEFSTTNTSLRHNQIRTLSGSVSLPNIEKMGDFYLEVAKQDMVDGRANMLDSAGRASGHDADVGGYAVYANANLRAGSTTLSLEGKHYRSFFPLSANVDSSTPGFGASEFNVLAYNQVPTVEPIYVEQLGQPNVCITGGRGRLDHRFRKNVLVYGWLGRYTSYSEITTNDDCVAAPELATHTWDAAIGTELNFDKGRSRFYAWAGARLTDREVSSDANAAGETAVFYREGYLRYDVIKHLAGDFSVQIQGVHRHRYEPLGFASPWDEGENYTALQWSPHWSAIFGYEYLAKDGCIPARPGEETISLCHYVNGGLQWRSAGKGGVAGQIFDSASVFVGQRRGAVRCVSGVCRQFPPFEGARLEVVSRF